MKYKSKIIICALTVGLLYSQTGYEIAKIMNDKPTPRDMKANLSMVLTNSAGKTRTSVIRSVSMEGGKKQMIWFLSPADDKGVAFLKIEHAGADDEMRLWLPAFNKVRRISSRVKGDSFMGSDMSYEDMTSRELNENTYELSGREAIDGVECFKLVIIPKPEQESTYSKHIAWVTTTGYNPIKEESYDLSGTLQKRKTFRFQRQKNYDLPTEIFVEDVQKMHTTRLTFEDLQVDTGLSEDLFQEKNLKRMPQ